MFVKKHARLHCSFCSVISLASLLTKSLAAQAQLQTYGGLVLQCSACQLRCAAAHMCTHLFQGHILQALEPAAQRRQAAAGTCVSTCQAALHQHQAGLPESSHAIPAATQQHRRVVQLDALSLSTHSLLLHALLALAIVLCCYRCSPSVLSLSASTGCW